MEDIEDDPWNFMCSYSAMLANTGSSRNDADVRNSRIATEMGDGTDVSQQTPDQINGQESVVGDKGSNPVRRELSNEDRVLAYQMLLQMSVNGKLKRTATTKVPNTFNVNIRAIQRLWKRGKESRNHNVSLNRVRNCGRKRIEFDLQRIREVPLSQRGTLTSLASALGVSRTFLVSKLKCGELRRHSNHVKPLLMERNLMKRIKHCLSMLDPGASPASLSFGQMENVIHIDEKWFQMTKKKQTYDLLPDEDDLVRYCKSSNFIPKIMFLAAVARPRYDHDGNCTFDGRTGVFPLVTEVAAIRSSANRVAGTLELKPILKIDRNIIRDYMIDFVLPAIRQKWPADSIMEPIIIQQDNAKTHIHDNDVAFLTAVHNLGMDIRLVCQPPNSPDLNVLDLGFFRAIQALQEKECANDVRKLVEAVNKAFCEFSHEKGNNIFITLQSCMVETLKILGSNRYKIPHMKKDHLARCGLLPTSLSCDPEIIATAAAHLPF